MKIGEYINKNFDHFYVRNLKQAPKRLEHFKKNIETINLKYEVFHGINGNDWVPNNFPHNKYLTGNALSFINIIFDAMKNNYKSFVCCDDDTIFYDYEIDEKEQNELIPNDWDIINLGNIKMKNNPSKIKFINIKNQPSLIEGSQCCAFNNKGYFILLKELFKFEQKGLVGDGLYDQLSKNDKINLYKLNPDFCYQEREVLKPYTIE